MAKLLCAVLNCTDEGTKQAKVKDSESGEESFRDLCAKHYDQIQRDQLHASWDPMVQAVRLV
jgi:hypothetical protein